MGYYKTKNVKVSKCFSTLFMIFLDSRSLLAFKTKTKNLLWLIQWFPNLFCWAFLWFISKCNFFLIFFNQTSNSNNFFCPIFLLMAKCLLHILIFILFSVTHRRDLEAQGPTCLHTGREVQDGACYQMGGWHSEGRPLCHYSGNSGQIQLWLLCTWRYRFIYSHVCSRHYNLQFQWWLRYNKHIKLIKPTFPLKVSFLFIIAQERLQGCICVFVHLCVCFVCLCIILFTVLYYLL